jgi:hypothetical protein
LRCRCRCGGKLHGAQRRDEVNQRFFENLPLADPHHIPDDDERRRREKLRRADHKRAEAVAMGQSRLFEETA